MKRIGILGGMGPESTAAYYLHITRTYVERFGSCAYPEIVIHSVSFQPYIDWPAADRWDLVTEGLVGGARVLETAGADFIVLATNTMHRVLSKIAPRIGIPFLSLLDVIGDTIASRGLKTVGLLGTRFTMEQPFYSEALATRSIGVLAPEPEDRALVDRTVYEELVFGTVHERSRTAFLRIIDRLVARGAEGIILGCTEIPLLVGSADCSVPLFDSTRIHAEAALDKALEDNRQAR